MNLERAIAIAVEAHTGQKDKAGEPYILHPLRVMSSLVTEEERIVGVLHDVVEDCPRWTWERLAAEGFSVAVLNAIECLTRRSGEPYDDFIQRCKGNSLARKVKLADLYDNLNPARVSAIGEQQMRRYIRAAIELGMD